jgi:hypothetical protein
MSEVQISISIKKRLRSGAKNATQTQIHIRLFKSHLDDVFKTRNWSAWKALILSGTPNGISFSVSHYGTISEQ